MRHRSFRNYACAPGPSSEEPSHLVMEEELTVSSPGELDWCLQENGAAILPGVLSAEECSALKDEIWSSLEHITSRWATPLHRGDTSTWRGLYQLWPKHSQLLQHWQLGCTQGPWNVRQHPRVQEAFATLWGVRPSELLCSIDGISVHLPPEITDRGYFLGENKLHCDQAFTMHNRDAVQGWVNANDTAEGDATLTFLHRSHRRTAEAAERFPELRSGGSWHQLTPEMIRFYTEECGCRQHSITCPGGSLVLWDSRTIHSGRESLRGRPQINERYVVYVCMTPRHKATQANRRKLCRAFYEMRMTGHSPHRPLLFPRRPRTYGRPLPEVLDVFPPHMEQHHLVGASITP